MNESVGVLTEAAFYILISLYDRLHGYGIMLNVEKISNGRVKLGAGTLYGAINTLIAKGFIKEVIADVSSRKKEYVITESGKRAVITEIARLEELAANGRRITEAHSNG